MAGMWQRYAAICRYELRQAWRNILTWAAGLCLLAIPLAMNFVFSGTIQVNGHPLAEKLRLTYAVVIGLTLVNFLSTLYVLCLCLERTGSSYLKHNDILILARATPRLGFWLAKLTGMFLPGWVYAFTGTVLLAVDIARRGAGTYPQLVLASFPIALGLAVVGALYLALRNHFGNFLIFFFWLLALPVLYVGNLWQLYGGILREAGPSLGVLTFLPQLGGLHGLALSLGHLSLWREGGGWALTNGLIWLVLGMVWGAAVFLRKRL